MAKAAIVTTPNFGSILDRPASDFERPVPLPAGTYLAVIQGLPRRDKSTKKQTDYIEYNVKFLKPFENDDGETDVDLDELKTMGGCKDKEMKLTFYITEKAGYRHSEFLADDIGIELEGKSQWEAAQEAAGQQLLVFVKQVPREDGKGMFSEIAKTAPVGE